jgi:hypothetical protein
MTSQSPARAAPPLPSQRPGEHELVGIAFSHFVEKARWALQRFGVPFRERMDPFRGRA